MAEAPRPHVGGKSSTASSHVVRRQKQALCFSFFVIIVSLLVGRDDGSVVCDDADHHHITPHGLERGKVIGNKVTADDLYTAYREIQQDYHTKAFSGHQKWKVLNRKEGVEISMLKHQSDPTCPYVKMKAIIPTSVQNCWDFLLLENWDETMPKMDPFYEGVNILGEYYKKGVQMVLARKRTKHILGFSKRDFVFISVSDVPKHDGTWVSGSVSVISPTLPRTSGYTRAFQDSIAFYKPLSSSKTEITIVCRIDLNDSATDGSGGHIPMWLYVKTIGATGARSVISMRRALIEEEERRRREAISHKREGMKFSLPWQYPILPTREEQELERREKRRREREEERHQAEEEAMRFSLPGKVPELPKEEDETSSDDVFDVSWNGNGEKDKDQRKRGFQLRPPWVKQKKDTKEEEERIGQLRPLSALFRRSEGKS